MVVGVGVGWVTVKLWRCGSVQSLTMPESAKTKGSSEARHGKTQVRIARHAELTVCNSFASLFRFKAYWNGFGIIRPFPSAFCFDYLIFVPEKVN